MEKTAWKNLPRALRNRCWGVSAAMINAILPFSRSGCSVPFMRYPNAPSSSASPPRDRALAFGVLGSGYPSYGATIRLPVGVAVMASRRPPLVPKPLSGREITKPRYSTRAYRIFLVWVISCHPRPLRFLPVGPGRYRGYRGDNRTRSCPSRTATAGQMTLRQLLPLISSEPSPLNSAIVLRSRAPQTERC
jgi:hypothetical protein